MKNVILKNGDDSVAVTVKRRKKQATFTFYQGTDFLMEKIYDDLKPAEKEYNTLVTNGYEIAF
jgi:hypothetical protein